MEVGDYFVGSQVDLPFHVRLFHFCLARVPTYIHLLPNLNAYIIHNN